MAAPTEQILVIAADALGSDGFLSKVAPIAPVTNEGWGKQSLNYQQLNYMFNNQAKWLKYVNEEQIPEEATTRSDEDTALRTTTGTANGDTNMGAFTGSVLPDNVSLKAVLQALGIGVDNIDNTTLPNEALARGDEDTAIRTTTGTANAATNMGAFTGTTISPNASTKVGMQDLETAVDDVTSTVTSHTGSANPHSDSQASSDWFIKSGRFSDSTDLADGADIVPLIPADFNLGHCHITLTQSKTIPAAWDLREQDTRTHYQTECYLDALGIVHSGVTTVDETLNDVRTAVRVDYVMIGRK